MYHFLHHRSRLIARLAAQFGAVVEEEEDPPATPNLSFSNVTDTGFDVTLTCDDTETSVFVEFNTSESWPGTEVAMADQGSGVWTGTISGQDPNTTLTIRGNATNGGGSSSYDTDTQAIAGPPSGSVSISGSSGATSNSVTLSFSTFGDSGSGTKFRWSYAGMDSWTEVDAGGASLSFEVLSLPAPETSFDFQGACYNAYGTGAWSPSSTHSTTA